MTAPAELNPEQGGVYRTPAEVERLGAEAQRSGVAWKEIDLAGVTDKRALLEAFARALALPATFGANWDALADSVEDLPVPAQGYVLRLRRATPLRLGADWPTLLEILREAALYWNERNRAFIAFVDEASELPLFPPWR